MKNNVKPYNLDTLQNDVFARIEREHITPTARFFYLFRNVSFWLLWIFTVLVGAIAVSILIFTELNAGWEVYEMTHKNAFTFFMESMPFIWLILLALVTLFGILNMRYTRRGYRHSLLWIVSLGLVGSIMGGLVLHTFRIDRYIDHVAFGLIPFHTPATRLRDKAWSCTDLGLYSGTIERIDVNGGTLTLRVANGSQKTFSLNFFQPESRASLELNSSVRIIATTTDTVGGLVACHISEWGTDDIQSVGEFEERKQAFLSGLETRITRAVGMGPQSLQDACVNLLRARHNLFGQDLPVQQ